MAYRLSETTLNNRGLFGDYRHGETNEYAQIEGIKRRYGQWFLKVKGHFFPIDDDSMDMIFPDGPMGQIGKGFNIGYDQRYKWITLKRIGDVLLCVNSIPEADMV
jgi:hypothetical protein